MKTEIEKLDKFLALKLNQTERSRIWESSDRILSQHKPGSSSIGLALGYVQSGKTTQMISLTAAAYDAGYRIIITILGTTNLLLEQNTERFTKYLQLNKRTDYRWVTMQNPKGKNASIELTENLMKGRAILIPILKHDKRISSLCGVLKKCNLNGVRVLIVDDEADQASLNTLVNSNGLSPVYKSITELRQETKNHLFIQFTATPYAPLLLEPEDQLIPEFIEFLTPGNNYVGGRQFFIDYATSVMRKIPPNDEQSPRQRPIELQESLKAATANFIAGAALLLTNAPDEKPISMLIHSTHRNLIQQDYLFLLRRLINNWRSKVDEFGISCPQEIIIEKNRLIELGAIDIAEIEFKKNVWIVLTQLIFWLVNSQSDVKKIRWKDSPIHILLGGNKLDRGFTVEGLTVTYMNRRPSDQIDTLEQRARAFGYRGDLLPYCQFFATSRTLKILKHIVLTEYDLRARLNDWVLSGGSIDEWAKEVGLFLPNGTRPTRSSVIQGLSTFNQRGGWHQLRMPSFNEIDMGENKSLLESLGLLNAPRRDWGRLQHRTLEMDSKQVVDKLIKKWKFSEFSPGWETESIVNLFESLIIDLSNTESGAIKIILMQYENEDTPRSREWRADTGFVNLLQGADTIKNNLNYYPGDREIPILKDGPVIPSIQIHRVKPNNVNLPEIFTMAVYLGQSQTVTRKTL